MERQQENADERNGKERVDVLASVRKGDYLFKRAPKTNEIGHDFLKFTSLLITLQIL